MNAASYSNPDPAVVDDASEERLRREKLVLEIAQLRSILEIEQSKLTLEVRKLQQDTTLRYRHVTFWGGIAAAAGVIFSMLFTAINTSREIAEKRDARVQAYQSSVATAFTQMMSLDDDTYVKGAMTLIPVVAKEPVNTYLPRLKQAASFTPAIALRTQLSNQLAEDADEAKNPHKGRDAGPERPLRGGRVSLFLLIVEQMPQKHRPEILRLLAENRGFGSERFVALAELAKIAGPSVWYEPFGRGNSRDIRVISTMLAESGSQGRQTLERLIERYPDRTFNILSVLDIMKPGDGLLLVNKAISSPNDYARQSGYTYLPDVQKDGPSLQAAALKAIGDSSASVRFNAFRVLEKAPLNENVAYEVLRRGLLDNDENVLRGALGAIPKYKTIAPRLLSLIQAVQRRPGNEMLFFDIDAALKAAAPPAEDARTTTP